MMSIGQSKYHFMKGQPLHPPLPEQVQAASRPDSWLQNQAAALNTRPSRLAHVFNVRGGSYGDCQSAEGGAATSSVHIYQVLSPHLVSRGRGFGSQLRLKGQEWECIDDAYFNAPGEGSIGLELHIIPGSTDQRNQSVRKSL